MEEFINLPRRTSLTKSGGEQNQWLCIIGGTGGSVQINGVYILTGMAFYLAGGKQRNS